MENIKVLRATCWIVMFCVFTALVLSAQTFKTLVNFNGPDGAEPSGTLAQGLDGNLYGPTYSGGPYGKYDFGTLFSLNSAGSMNTVYDFCSQQYCLDGSSPYGGLVLGTDGNFYGTTVYDGVTGVGTVFKVTPDGTLTTLYSFCPQGLPLCSDGMNPHSGLVEGADGNFYGTTQTGGANCNRGFNGCGTVFRITSNGELTTLYNFCSQNNCADGAYPSGALALGADGNFYGTTSAGGDGKGGAFPGGTIYRISPSGSLTTIYNFCQYLNCTDGDSPEAGLIQYTDGSFYGTTESGGAASYMGTIFKVNSAGVLSTLYRFCEGIQTKPGIPPILPYQCYDGSMPEAGLVLASDGNFYGTTYAGGFVKNAQQNCNGYCGTVFRVTPQGQFRTLHRFRGSDGNELIGGLVQATDGRLYGTTALGGAVCVYCGTVFQLGLGLDPFVLANPGFGRPGRVVQILGDHLTETSTVTFNGTPAQFEVMSDTFIKAIVPKGAATGIIQVTTSSGILDSNVAFRVLR